MKTFFAVLKNNYLRLIPRIGAVAVFTACTLATVIFAVYITGTQQVKAHIVYIPQSASETAPRSSKSLGHNGIAGKAAAVQSRGAEVRRLCHGGRRRKLQHRNASQR